MNIYPYVYRLDHPETGEFYIGYRAANKVPAEQDLGHKYFTSSKSVKPRFHEFSCQIIAEFFTKEDAYDFEQELIYENWNNDNIINASCFYLKQNRLRLNSHTETSKRKISASRLGYKMPEETKIKLRNINLGKHHSDNTKELLRQQNLGREIHWADKISAAKLGIKFTEEHKAKLKKPKTKEHKAKLSLASKQNAHLSRERMIQLNKSKRGIPKQKNVCRISDRKEMNIANFIRWLNRENLQQSALVDQLHS